MIRDPAELDQFEKEQLRCEDLTFVQALKLFEGMWKEGMALGVLPLKDPLEGIEVDIAIARVLNHGFAKSKSQPEK